jgi:hypothetical protein
VISFCPSRTELIPESKLCASTQPSIRSANPSQVLYIIGVVFRERRAALRTVRILQKIHQLANEGLGAALQVQGHEGPRSPAKPIEREGIR